MKLKEYIGYVIADFKARLRGERRVAPRGVRGRVYAKKDETEPSTGGTSFLVKKEPVASLAMRVTRTDGSVETIKVPAKVQ